MQLFKIQNTNLSDRQKVATQMLQRFKKEWDAISHKSLLSWRTPDIDYSIFKCVKIHQAGETNLHLFITLSGVHVITDAEYLQRLDELKVPCMNVITGNGITGPSSHYMSHLAQHILKHQRDFCRHLQFSNTISLSDIDKELHCSVAVELSDGSELFNIIAFEGISTGYLCNTELIDLLQTPKPF